MSVCYNAVDRHVASGKGDQLALVHDSPLTDTVRKITYGELKDQVTILLERILKRVQSSIKYGSNTAIVRIHHTFLVAGTSPKGR